MPEDKWGLSHIYATKTTAGVTGKGTGFLWQQNGDITKDNDSGMVRFGKEQAGVDVISTSTGEFMFPFALKESLGDYLKTEGPTGHHSGGETHGCEGAEYGLKVLWNVNPAKFTFEKQMFHGGSQIPDPTTGQNWTDSRINYKLIGVGRWLGWKWIKYNKANGVSAGIDSVVLELWWNDDPTNDKKKWFRVLRTEDKGGWGSGGNTCGGRSDQQFNWSSIQTRIKSGSGDFSLHPIYPEPEDGDVVHAIGGAKNNFADDEERGYDYKADLPRDIELTFLFKIDNNDGQCHFKNMSMREIDPTKAFDDDQNAPPPTQQPGETTRVKGFHKIIRDLNTYRTSPCEGSSGGGGGGGKSKVYEVAQSGTNEKEISDNSSFSNRKRVAVLIVNSSSVLKGVIVTQADVDLRKQGSPGASPVVNFKIWDSTGVVKYTSTTNIDPTTLPTSFGTKTTFSMSTNTYALQVGDRLGVEYLGTSSSNYVVIAYATDGNGIGADNNEQSQYEGSSWDDKSSRDPAMVLWQG